MKRILFIGLLTSLLWPIYANAASITSANVVLEQRRFDPNYWANDDQSFMLTWAEVNYQDLTANSTDNPVIINSTPTGTVTMNYSGFWPPNEVDEVFTYKFDHGLDIASMETTYEFSIENVPESTVERVVSPGSLNPLFEYVVPTIQGKYITWSAVDGASDYRVKFWNLTQGGDIDSSTILGGSEPFNETQYIIPDEYYAGEYALSIEARNIIGEDLTNRTRFYTITEAADPDTDFNADSISDILFQHSGDNRLLIWTMDNFDRTVKFPYSLAAVWDVVGKGDFNADGTTDVLYRRDDGTVAIYEMENTARSNMKFPGGIRPVWSVQGVGDFNGDNTDDILWRRSTDGLTMIWGIVNSARAKMSWPGGLANFWDIVGIGDFDGDHIDDVLCQHNSDGRLLIWKMNNYGRAQVKLPQSIDSTWAVVGVGDFNDDGTDDVLYRNDIGDTAVAEFSNLNRSAIKFPGGIGLPWSVKEVGDYDGDGSDDIFFRRASDGVTLIWAVVDSERSTITWPGGLDLQWEVQ